MTKKAVILIIVFVLLLGVGGVFWLLGSKNESLIEEVKFESPKNFVIEDTAEGKIVENRNAGLSFKVPEGWKVEPNKDYIEEGLIDLLSPDVEINGKTNFPEQGCGIAIRIEYNETEFQLTKNIIENLDIEDSEIIEISKYSALKEIVFDNPKIGRSISVRVPVNNKLYFFETLVIPKEKERCLEEFNKFLETVSID